MKEKFAIPAVGAIIVKKVENEVKRRQDASGDALQALTDKRSTLQADYHKQEDILNSS